MTTLAAAALVAGLLVLASPAQAVPPGATVLVDRPSGFGALPFDGIGDSEVGPNALSSDGCFVVFSSHSDVLSATDDNAAENVFQLDLCQAGSPLAQVNTSSDGTPAEPLSDSEGASISADGRYVAFSSDAANLMPGVTAREDEIFVKDLATGTLELASRGDGPNGRPAERAAVGAISGDGRSVAFVASGVLDTDNVNGAAAARDAYVRSLDDDTTHMVSVTTGDTRGGGVDSGTPPAIDHTGARVAFVTQNGLVPGDNDGSFDAYVRNQVGGGGESTQLVSVGAGADSAGALALSGSSTRLAYTNGRVWVATCAFTCGPPTQADGVLPGGTNSGGAEGPLFPRPIENGVPQDPTELYWRTPAPLDPADTDGAIDLYGRSLAAPPGSGTFQVSTADGDVGGADVADGFFIVFDMQQTTSLPGSDGTTRQVWLASIGGFANISQPLGAPPRINGAGSARLGRRHVTSDDGRIVAFASAAPALGSPLRRVGYADQVLVRDVVSGQTTLVSVAPDGVTPGNGDSFQAGVDAAGRRVAFTSTASNLVAGVTGEALHVYVRDLHTGTTTLLDRTTAGAPAGAQSARISGNGAAVVFESRSPDLPGAPGDGNNHVYRTDLAGGQIGLVDRSSSGAVANRGASDPDVSADGNRVAFTTTATNLGGGTALNDDVYVRDLAARTTTWASVPEDGDPAHSSARDPAISADGLRVAFTQELPEFGYGAIDQDEVFVRDLAAGRTTLASTGPLGPADTGAIESSLSGDGTKVTFISAARNLGGPVDRFRTAYVHDLVSRMTSPVAQGHSSEDVAVLSGNGACVALESGSDDLVAGYGPDFGHVLLHALDAGCAPSGVAGGSGPGADTTAPLISGLRVTNRRFAAGRRSTPLIAKARRGTTFVFRLSEDARTTITIARKLQGRRKGRRCVTPHKGLRRRCTRLVAAATITRARTRAGTNRIAYTGRTRGRALRPGRYRATVRAVDAAANRSAPRRVAFTVVRR
jgi:Tol biopolymer transport system component